MNHHLPAGSNQFPLLANERERDACGVGFVARIDGQPSHALVLDAVAALERMAHRGGSGCGFKAADGAGVLLPIPRNFMRLAWQPVCGELPALYGIGHFFLPAEDARRARAEQVIARILREHELVLLGWRDTPVRPETLGPEAAASMPRIRQVLAARAEYASDTSGASYGESDADEEAFERVLYIVRRHIELALFQEEKLAPHEFHAASFSCRSIVYKGLLHGGDLARFYPDLTSRDFTAYFAIFHERYSTNTKPSWRLAQPFRCLAHNGEINTLPSNQAAMAAREPALASPLFGDDIRYVTPVLDHAGSDSSMLDNAMELLMRGGRSLTHSAMMLVPEAFGQSFIMGEDKRAFYEYHATLMEPWDGPAALVFTDGRAQVGAMLDRNALRPCRYAITKDGMVLLASEAGVLDIPEERVSRRGRLHPRRMLLVDFTQRRVVSDAECKGRVIYARPYRHWISQQGVALRDLPFPSTTEAMERGGYSVSGERVFTDARQSLLREQRLFGLGREQRLFGLGKEEVSEIIMPMAQNSQEPVASMGTDIPLAVLSHRPQLLFSYLKQRFAQVTNPPIDPLREELVMTLTGFLGRRGNLLEESPEHYALLRLSTPVLLPEEMQRLLASEHPAVRVERVPMTFALPKDGSPDEAGRALQSGMDELCAAVESALDAGASIIVLSDALVSDRTAPIPSLLAVSGLHHHLLRLGRRNQCGIVVDTGETRDVMQMAQLIAFGAGAVHPRMALATVNELARSGKLGPVTPLKARAAYVAAAHKGLLKTFSRMGVSTLRSFSGGQYYEAIGLGPDLVERYFTGLPSRLGGIGLNELAVDVLRRHAEAFAGGWGETGRDEMRELSDHGLFRFRAGGEKHLWSPEAIRSLHKAVRENDAESYAHYARQSDAQSARPVTLRALLRFAKNRAPVPLEEVEPETDILRRFTGAAMSYGSLSAEAHEAIAIALNRVGGRSNCGEGGELAERRVPLPNGDSRRSRIRQIASGRFGVTATYLAHADEIQIKMAQGAKPGEGGQLPAHKVLADIARVRRTIAGVTLISPPPHHDIYSIEDLAQLVYDLRRLQPSARVSVKLVAGSNVGTIACGVAKAGADTILISGHDGGTGASPRTAISYVGLPWELGLAEAHQALCASGLRPLVTLQTDGQLRTGLDLAMAALLGAQEFGFGTSLMVCLGCCLLRVCHLNTCSMGIATQDPRLRAKQKGTADHVENFLRFLASDLRGHMAQLGFRTLDEMVGHAEALEQAPLPTEQAVMESDSAMAEPCAFVSAPAQNTKTSGASRSASAAAPSPASLWLRKIGSLDLSPLLVSAPLAAYPDTGGLKSPDADPFGNSELEAAMLKELLPAVKARQTCRFEGVIRNTDRAVCARLAGEIALLYGEEGLPPGMVDVTLRGTAGQSAGAFLTRGVTLSILGEANDYVGKGLSGGVIAVSPPHGDTPGGLGVLGAADSRAAIGNVALYGATAGELFAAGSAGERFAVRNSGASAVVEGVGDHGCEYMTGGVVVVLGPTGYNFAAGMSGGVAYVYDRSEIFQNRCNMDNVDIEGVWRADDIQRLRGLVEKHARMTASPVAQAILDDWNEHLPLFLKVTPIGFSEAMARLKRSESPTAETMSATEEVYGRQ